MKKCIKRLYAFLCMLVMLVSITPNLAYADETETRVAINVKVPGDWQNPCLWAWDDDGKSVFEAWPGDELEARTDNDGWSYIWIPDWATHVIVNGNNGEVQTEEIILEGKDAWITVNSADSVDVSYEAQTKGETPEYVETFVVHAKVDESWAEPALWAWSAPDGTNAFSEWPGKSMKQGEDGWYTAKAPVFVNSIIINANSGNVQTEDLSIDAAEVWVVVDAEGKAEFSYKDPDKAAVENISVHVKAPSDWASPCLWAWSAPDGTNAFSAWPGEALVDENGWLTLEVPGWVNSIIVNGNEGGVQTTDISIEPGKEVWVVVNGPEDYEVSYEEPAVEEKTEDSQAKATPIVPIAIGCVAAVLVIAVIVVLVMKKKK